uniref:Uncharacterized protein n=1 Tax=Rhizophora mucronata TaxID=61149 RepID=A0A2P2NAC0_RHIMU
MDMGDCGFPDNAQCVQTTEGICVCECGSWQGWI